jgi:hypothetical protein
VTLRAERGARGGPAAPPTPRPAERSLTDLTRFLIRMGAFLAAVVAVSALLIGPLIRMFQANPALNGLILLVALFGIGYIFRQVLLLRPEVEWLERFRRPQPSLTQAPAPRLLASMAAMLGERQGRLALSATSTRSMLDGISARLDESRETSRYLIGLLVFLGLLGTFWGLLQTVNAVGGTISSLNPTGDVTAFFGELQRGLQEPLGGMGVAFSSSLFGLASSLVLGFLELQAGQAQNRFYLDLEEWLASHTRLSSGAISGDGDGSVPAYVQALLEQTADSLDNLQRILARNEEGRMSGQHALMSLSEKLATLTDQMRTEQDLLIRLAESQMALQPALQRLAQGSQGLDEPSRNHLRNIDVYVMRLLEDQAQGRNQLISEVRSEIKLLARTIAALAEEPGPRR